MLVVPGRYWLSLGLLVSLAVCKGDGDGATAQEVCELTLSCSCSVPAYATVEACVADYDAEQDKYSDLAGTYGLTFNDGCFSTFLGLVQEIGCRTEFPGEDASCSEGCSLMYGDKPLGAACTSFGDFDQFSDCANNLRCSSGECVDPCTRLAAGAACSDPEFKLLGTCADGLYCDIFDSMTCKAAQGVGGPCSGFGGCKDGLACGAGGTCETLPKEGEACPNLVCAAGLSCDGTCVAPPGEGEACTGSCAAGLDCDDDVCVVAEPLLCEPLFLE